MLDKQVSLFSVNTDAFLHDEERDIKNSIRDFLCMSDEMVETYEDKLIFDSGFDECEIRKCFNEYDKSGDIKDNLYAELVQLRGEFKNGIKKQNNKYKANKKKELLELLSNNLNKQVRQLDRRYVEYVDTESGEIKANINNVISMFESELTRSFNIECDSLTYDIMVVEAWYYDLIQDLILNGFDYNNDHYIYFTSSAGQIRTKKCVFVKESTYLKVKSRLMCGLDEEKINSTGGMNINKFLAYLALCNSSTSRWSDVFGKEFDINKCVVVDDFETTVNDVADYINWQTYEIEHSKHSGFQIPHTDGCGLISSEYSKKNFMVRLPFIKGLLGSFDFKRFIRENNCSSIVTDIWGDKHDIIAEDIQIIFTKSQIKMAQHYSSFTDYATKFTENKCEACVCNIEPNYIKQATINYQMLQSLYDMTEKEVEDVCEMSNNKIRRLSSSLENMLEVFGAKEGIKDVEGQYFKKALRLYPELIKDASNKDTLRDLKNSLVNKYKSGRLEIKGKFTFVLPDLYAFCEHLFCGKEVPNGLLDSKEVYCRLYRNSTELDCLRSPSLYLEHAIMNNVCNKKKNGGKISEWFNTDAIYVSTHDLMSRILQFDM